MNISISLFKIRLSNIALNQTLTLKLGVTLVLTVTQVVILLTPTKRLPCHLNAVHQSLLACVIII